MHHKFLKKFVGALGFKLIDKDIIKNNRMLSDNTCLNLNKVIENLFLSNQLKSIIQIGANDGNRFDHLNKFIKKYYPQVFFVEPIKTNFEDLKKNYINQKNLFFENSAISVNDQINTLYKVKESKLSLYNDHVIGITSFNKDHLIKHGIKTNHITKEHVQSISLTELLKKYSINNFDLLFIDTEGYDGEIIIDFLESSKIRPFIIFEYIHIKNKTFKKTLEMLNKEKFFYIKIEENIFCFPQEKKELQRLI